MTATITEGLRLCTICRRRHTRNLSGCCAGCERYERVDFADRFRDGGDDLEPEAA